MLAKCPRNGTTDLPCFLLAIYLVTAPCMRCLKGGAVMHHLERARFLRFSPSISEVWVSPCHLQSLLTWEHLIHLLKGRGSLPYTSLKNCPSAWLERKGKRRKQKKICSLQEINPGCLSPCLLSMCLKLLTWKCWFFHMSLNIIIPLSVCNCSTRHIAITWWKQA